MPALVLEGGGPVFLPSIIADKDNQGIFPQPFDLQGLHKASHGIVHMGDGSGIKAARLVFNGTVWLYPFFLFLQGVMGNAERNIEKKRLALVPYRGDEPGGFVPDQVRGVAFFFNEPVIPVLAPVPVLVQVRILVYLSVQVSVGMFKSVLTGPGFRTQAQVPFSGNSR